jgi:hypothetical protein
MILIKSRFKPWMVLLFCGLTIAVSAACTQTDEDAELQLMMQLMEGLLIAEGGEDDATAVMLVTKAAEQGLADAQYYLGVMYERGEGVPEHDVIAYMWFNLAEAQGFENAKGEKDTLTEEMTAADVSKAQVLSRECLAQNYKNCGY